MSSAHWELRTLTILQVLSRHIFNICLSVRSTKSQFKKSFAVGMACRSLSQSLKCTELRPTGIKTNHTISLLSSLHWMAVGARSAYPLSVLLDIQPLTRPFLPPSVPLYLNQNSWLLVWSTHTISSCHQNNMFLVMVLTEGTLLTFDIVTHPVVRRCMFNVY